MPYAQSPEYPQPPLVWFLKLNFWSKMCGQNIQDLVSLTYEIIN